MMKKLLVFVSILIGFMGVYAQGAKIKFKDETINYGTVTRGEDDGKRKFEFTNTGDAPLEIKNVRSSCGCTVASKPTGVILPGKSDFIEVQYSMNVGPISKSITVETNAVNVPEGMVALRIKGMVVEKKIENVLEKKKSILEQ